MRVGCDRLVSPRGRDTDGQTRRQSPVRARARYRERARAQARPLAGARARGRGRYPRAQRATGAR
ncbi:hypothetical protein BRC92_00410 [Halobacteriales archaeon QS_4_69_31]|nr:MAG: hypothetical protein BRC92_00410 [Halobacteriales archaeon QS_4_69_31]